jgi:hypothetical protein
MQMQAAAADRHRARFLRFPIRALNEPTGCVDFRSSDSRPLTHRKVLLSRRTLQSAARRSSSMVDVGAVVELMSCTKRAHNGEVNLEGGEPTGGKH